MRNNTVFASEIYYILNDLPALLIAYSVLFFGGIWYSNHGPLFLQPALLYLMIKLLNQKLMLLKISIAFLLVIVRTEPIRKSKKLRNWKINCFKFILKKNGLMVFPTL